MITPLRQILISRDGEGYSIACVEGEKRYVPSYPTFMDADGQGANYRPCEKLDERSLFTGIASLDSEFLARCPGLTFKEKPGFEMPREVRTGVQLVTARLTEICSKKQELEERLALVGKIANSGTGAFAAKYLSKLD